jgi:hypothetical protein
LHKPDYYPFQWDDIPEQLRKSRADGLADITRQQFRATVGLQTVVLMEDMCRSQDILGLQDIALRRVERLIRTLKAQRDAEGVGESKVSGSESGPVDTPMSSGGEKGKGKRRRED